MIKIVKYAELTASLKQPGDLPFDDDRAVADFRAFYQVGCVHTSRVSNSLAVNTMLEILENLRDDLLARKSKGL